MNQNNHPTSNLNHLYHNYFLFQAAAKLEPPQEQSLVRMEEELLGGSLGKASSPLHTSRAAPQMQRGLLWSVSQQDWKV